MRKWLERIPAPRKLFLAWQAPDHLADRFRWAVADLAPAGQGDLELCYLGSGTRFESANQGRKFREIQALGYQGYPGYRLEFVHKNVLATLMRRLPPRNRSDFAEYRKQFRIPPDVSVPDVALLGVTEAKLPSDGFSVVNPLDPDAADCDLLMEVAGYRYYADHRSSSLYPGHPVELTAEPGNLHDPRAVMISAGAIKLGYINRLQAPTFQKWLTSRQIRATIDRLNGRADKPRAFVFIQARS